MVLFLKLDNKVPSFDPISISLEFDFKNYANGPQIKNKCLQILPRGSIVVFPSYMWHRVTPITRGTRHSLVQWNSGPPFK